MNSITTKISMIMAACISAVIMYKYVMQVTVATHLYRDTAIQNKILFIASIPLGFVSLSCLMLLLTVPVMMVMQWHLSKIEQFRDIW
jgi:energy-coupling factor transporter transmembrane protein EcfT